MKIISCNLFSIAWVHQSHTPGVSQHFISSFSHVVAFTTLSGFNHSRGCKTKAFFCAALCLQFHNSSKHKNLSNLWYLLPDSNRQAVWATDFKSVVSTNSTKQAYYSGYYQICQRKVNSIIEMCRSTRCQTEKGWRRGDISELTSKRENLQN